MYSYSYRFTRCSGSDVELSPHGYFHHEENDLTKSVIVNSLMGLKYLLADEILLPISLMTFWANFIWAIRWEPMIAFWQNSHEENGLEYFDRG